MNCFKEARRVVVKVGSSTLTHETGLVNLRRIEALVRVLADIKNSGKELILVSSGAISVGLGKLGLRERPADTPGKQAMAAIGQCELMYLYDNLFGAYNHTVAQVLLTRDVVEEEHRKAHCVNAFKRLLELGVIPIVNENDTVAVEEIEFGDNDSLSALVAVLAEADALVIISDIDGLYDSDPRQNPRAKLIGRVESIDESIAEKAGGAGSKRGTGGMLTKVRAAQLACGAGVDMAIINGKDPALLYDLFDGKPVGTHFVGSREAQVK